MISKIFEFLKTSFSESTLNYIEEAYTRALGTGLYLGMFFLAVIFIIFELKKKEKDRIKLVFGFYSVIVLILAVNPIFANISIKVIGSSVYWRIYWLLPLGIVLAYVFTELIYKMPTKTQYKVGETLDVSGGILQLNYTNGTYDRVELLPLMTSGFSSETVGMVTVRVDYVGMVTYFNVEIIAS